MGSTFNVDCEANMEARYRLFHNRIGVVSEVQVDTGHMGAWVSKDATILIDKDWEGFT
jgi:hypothetical protein